MHRLPAREPARCPLLRRLRRTARARLSHLRARQSARRVLLQRLRRASPARAAAAARDRAARIHAAASRRAHPPHARRHRGRAQARHRAVRRPGGLDAGGGAPRPRGHARGDGPLLPLDPRAGASLRRHREPVPRRRRDGAVRRAARARGCAAARGAGRARDPARAGAAARASWTRASAWTSGCASASTPGPWSWAASATTCAWTTPPSATRRISPRACRSSRRRAAC